MNEDVIADLKQFIAATMSQQTADITTRVSELTTRVDDIAANMATKDDLADLDKKLSGKIDRLETKVDDIQSAIGDALDTSNDAIHAQLQDHERRITRLEPKHA